MIQNKDMINEKINDQKPVSTNVACVKVMKPSISKGKMRIGVAQDQPC